MAAIPSSGDSTNSTCEWTCTRTDCTDCASNCAYIFYCGTTTAIAVPRRRRYARSDDVYTEEGIQKLVKELKDNMPEKAAEPIFIRHMNDETMRLWRKLQRYRRKYKPVFRYKPTIKRRLNISKSGWLPRGVRRRKKGH